VDSLKTTWAKSWFNVKTRLESMKEHFISYKQYQDLCVKQKITTKDSQDTLVDFLNDLGVILHFNDFDLLDTHVLEPRWVTEGVYKIINSKLLAEKAGILKLDRLGEILAKSKKDKYYYPPDKYRFVIELMMKFELCYKIDSSTILVPDLLDVEIPDFDFAEKNPLKLIISYDFLPRSVMPRFIVKMHSNIDKDLRWRKGVVLCDDSFNSRAVIRADDDEKRIYISVNGDQKRDYYAVIRHSLFEINDSFEKLKAVERLCLPDDFDVTVSYQHLLTLEKIGQKYYVPEGTDREYNVKELLGSVRLENSTEKEILNILRALKKDKDDEKTLLKKADKLFEIKPGAFGVSVDVKKLVKMLFKK